MISQNDLQSFSLGDLVIFLQLLSTAVYFITSVILTVVDMGSAESQFDDGVFPGDSQRDEYSPQFLTPDMLERTWLDLDPILVWVWPFANLLMARWLEIDPSASEQFWMHNPSGPNVERFIEFWTLTYFCMTTDSPLAVQCSLEASFQQLLCWVVDFMFQQVFLNVRRELHRSSDMRALHDWVSAFGNCHIFHKLQTVKKLSQWSQTSNHPGVNGNSCQPTDSGNIAVRDLYRTVCEWGTIRWVTILMSWFDIHSACSQFVRPNSGRILAWLRPRCEFFLTMLGHLAGIFSPFSFTHDSVVDKVIHMDCGCRHCYTFTKRLVGQSFSSQRWTVFCFMGLQLADGANPGPDCFGITDECLWPGRDPSANNSTSMSWMLPALCSAISLFATWVLRKWWIFLPPAATMEEVDYATLGAALGRINIESNSLRQEVSSLSGGLSEIFSVVTK